MNRSCLDLCNLTSDQLFDYLDGIGEEQAYHSDIVGDTDAEDAAQHTGTSEKGSSSIQISKATDSVV